MTRETKIGLLVGLAFIIVIGILLSDQLMRSTEPPSAPLASVADTVRKATVSPASTNIPVTPVTTQQFVAPENPIPMREEITRRPPPVTLIEIRPGQGNGVENAGNNTPNNPAPVPLPGGRIVQPIDNIATNTNNTGGNSLADIAARNGETLIGPDGQPLRANRNPLPPINGQPTPEGGNTPRHPGAGEMKQYKVEAGDSLSKIASKIMGSNSKANRDAIIKANPTLQANPDKVIIGQTYNIPPAVTTATNVTPTPTPAPTPAPAPAPLAKKPEPAPLDNLYVVQPGDSLTRIAKDQVGDVTSMSAIKDLNRDVVKNWDVLQVGTKLRLPAKPVASAR